MADELQMSDPLFFEKIIIKLLFTNNDARDKVLPFLVPKIFYSIEARNIVKSFLKFNADYNDVPSLSTFRMEIENEKDLDFLDSTVKMDISGYNKQHLLDKTEQFIKQSLLYQHLTEAVDCMEGKKFEAISDIPDKLREDLAFTFNPEVGLDLISDVGEEVMFDHLHNKDKTISTGITYFDDKIEDGFHEKTLSLFLGECVTANTKVLIRKRKKACKT